MGPDNEIQQLRQQLAERDRDLGELQAQVTVLEARLAQEQQERAAEKAASAHSEEHYREVNAELEAILASLPDAVYVGNANGIFRCNQAALDNLGCRDIAELQDQIPVLNEKLQNRYAGSGEPIRPEDEAFARALRGQPWTNEVISCNLTTGEDIVQRSAARPIWREGQVVAAVAVDTDITEQKRAEKALREKEWFLEKAQEVAHVGSWISDPGDSGKLVWSREVYRIFGVEDQGFDGQVATFWAFVHPDDRDRVWRAAMDALARGRGYDIDHRIVCPDGTVRWVHEAADVQRDAAGTPTKMIGVVQDITQRKAWERQMEEALAALSQARNDLEMRVKERTSELQRSREQTRTYARRLVEEVENERRFIARELHDEAGQSLTSILIGLRVVEQEARRSAAHLVEPIQDVKRETDAVMEGLHRISRNLRPASLDRLGLVAALRQHIQAYEQQTGIQVDFAPIHFDNGRARVPGEVETAVYRVVQEALTNAARHAEAQRIDIVLKRKAQRVLAIIEDDGRGFDVSEALARGRLGLAGMRERAELLGGRFTIESSIGQGTTLFLDIPTGSSSDQAEDDET